VIRSRALGIMLLARVAELDALLPIVLVQELAENALAMEARFLQWDTVSPHSSPMGLQ